MQESCEEAFRCSEALAPVMSKAEKDEAKMEVLRKVSAVSSWRTRDGKVLPCPERLLMSAGRCQPIRRWRAI